MLDGRPPDEVQKTACIELSYMNTMNQSLPNINIYTLRIYYTTNTSMVEAQLITGQMAFLLVRPQHTSTKRLILVL